LVKPVPSEIDDLTGQLIGAAIEVHKALGSGLLESAYATCLCRELDLRAIPYEKEKPLPIAYKGAELECGYRLDILVDNRLIVELKTCEIQSIHEAQLLTYLKLTRIKTGLLMNFNVPILKRGIKRLSLRGAFLPAASRPAKKDSTLCPSCLCGSSKILSNQKSCHSSFAQACNPDR
jgi:GxxExxY protein